MNLHNVYLTWEAELLRARRLTNDSYLVGEWYVVVESIYFITLILIFLLGI